jgi:tRNA pseudouridine38-40 synthase
MAIYKYVKSMNFLKKKLLLPTGGKMAYRYFIKIAYNGAAYGGWQIQPNAVTIQQWMNDGLTAIAGIKEAITGCGRTDAGVHATVFYAHFDHEIDYSSEELTQLTFRLNRFLPRDIVVFEISPVFAGAHARYSALWREYEYLIIRQKDPFSFQQAYLVHDVLSIEIMNNCAEMLLGRHDFQCFSKVNTQVNNYLCDIKMAEWTEQDHFLKFTIRADRFLRNMVRAIVGTILDVGRGKISFNEFQQIIDSRSRSKAGYSVPAKGLTLTGVGYPAGIFSDKPVFFLPEEKPQTLSHYYSDEEFHGHSDQEIKK